MDVSKNSGTPKSSILIGFSIINHPFWGTPIFGNIHIKGALNVLIFQAKKMVCFALMNYRLFVLECCPGENPKLFLHPWSVGPFDRLFGFMIYIFI